MVNSLSSAVSVKIRQNRLFYSKLYYFSNPSLSSAFEGLRDRQVEMAYLGLVMLFGGRIPGQVVFP